MKTGEEDDRESRREHPLITFRGVTKVYGAGQAAVEALRGIDLRIDAGEFLAVMGPSGSGKSTCMNILGCLDTPTAGTYLFKDIEVGGLSRKQRAVLLADEPTGNLDRARGREIMELLSSLNSDGRITIIIVTHDPDMAAYAKRIVNFLGGLVESDERNGRAQ